MEHITEKQVRDYINSLDTSKFDNIVIVEGLAVSVINDKLYTSSEVVKDAFSKLLNN